jgi:hypothetical protein
MLTVTSISYVTSTPPEPICAILFISVGNKLTLYLGVDDVLHIIAYKENVEVPSEYILTVPLNFPKTDDVDKL